MLEKFHQKYSKEDAQEEARKIKQKVDSGETDNYKDAERLYERGELEKAFRNQNDLAAAHGIITRELFGADKEGKNTIEDRIDAMDNGPIKEAAYFNLAKMHYELDGNLEKALEVTDKISYADEKARCLVHLANGVLNNEMDVPKAEDIIQKVTVDPKGYLRYFENEKKRIQKLIEQKQAPS